MPIATKKPTTTVDYVRAYLFHGVRIIAHNGGRQGTADCPFCGKEGKFSVNLDTGQWRCFVCAAGTDKGGGNLYIFLRELHKFSMEGTDDYEELRADRKLLEADTLRKWGVCKSFTTEDWLVPGFGVDGEVNQLYRYLKDQASGRMRLLPTPGITHYLHGVNLYNPNKKNVFLCEGIWDGAALWETLKVAKPADKGYSLTANTEISLLNTHNVLAVNSCNVFFDSWCSLFADKNVYLMYDNDHPRMHHGRRIEPAGWKGMEHTAQVLGAAETPPAKIMHLKWGDEGFTRALASGYDVRDFLAKSSSPTARVYLLGQLLEKTKPIPAEWIIGRSKEAIESGSPDIQCIPCYSWNDLVQCWRKPMKWTEGLDRALSLMLATIASTKILGDPLWVQIMSPPSSGKSVLCEAVSINRKYVVPKDTMTGLFSGFQMDKDAEEDFSLVSKLKDKTLAIKDGDTVLQAPNKAQILSQFRALFDRSVRTSYGNRASRDYEGMNVTVILCGTSSLIQLDTSELGERFLKCIIMDTIDDELEDEILWRVVNRTDRIMSVEADGSFESRHDPDMVRAMQMTGGYVEYLRTNAGKLLAQVDFPDDMKLRCIRLGKYVAYMRARPSTKQSETAEREFAARLVSQLVRVAKCLAIVLNRKSVDEEVLRRVKRIALDSSRGRTMEICKHLHREGRAKGASIQAMSTWTNQTEDAEKTMLRFLRRIGVVELFNLPSKSGVNPHPRWRMTERIASLYEEIVVNPE